MKILNKLKTNSKGFAHVELIIIVLVVAVIAGSGYFVYQHHKKSNVAHAGSYNYGTMGSAVSDFKINPNYSGPVRYTLKACKLGQNTAYGYLWNINFIFTTASAVQQNGANVAYMGDWSTGSFITGHLIAYSPNSTSWWYGVASGGSFWVNPAVNNYLFGFAGNGGGEVPGNNAYERAGSLNNC